MIAWKALRHHPEQARLWRTKARFVAVAAGRGSGKTELARRRIVRWLNVDTEKNPANEAMYLYACPTIEQARRIAWIPIKKLVPREYIRKINETTMTIETIYGSMLYVCGMDKPQRAEGVQWNGVILDESSDQRPRVFELNILPTLSHKNGWCWRIGVPKRYGIGAADFKRFYESKDTDSYTWPSSTVLTPEQLEYALNNNDARDFDEQYNARWGSASGAIFHSFDEKLNVDASLCIDPNEPIIVGSDFNVDPMAWIIAQRTTDKTCLNVIDEIWLRNTNTIATLNELFNRYGSHQAGFNFFGDASGRARKTSASQSDYIQIKNDTRFRNARVFYPKANPIRADRFAATNAMLCNAAFERRCKVHPRCKHLIQDLLERTYIEGTTEADDYGDVGHISDALGYPIYRMFPIRIFADDTDAPIYA